MKHAVDDDERTHEIRDDTNLAVSVAFDIASDIVGSELGDDILAHPIKERFEAFLVMPVGKLPVGRVGDDDAIVGSVRVDLAEGGEEAWTHPKSKRKRRRRHRKKS